ncbi:unnamed protein product [Zymoseptoria tritici ST99CH_1A5]|uniref:CUE domain-containing protein n=3 Tax=Zymoseptoria tritici TaxID=1047171 RepID=F9X197_ZYMTI|nr:uncharacterized protein MYCGRDRAFT_107425 [Zymoseptoria tritici IPO323]EGP91456.1 hypothetical protein MYCGRDRAFT_107425 [Zymoseptoria tritici IPO323]SMR42639.1 unnamed protein product [Zymoseptoria tritici ST99CH_1E4]SMR44813.1 unnamed protein product [Zymoseptoria tritici ST99CH_3D1]SMY19977.1 unnamed protein product [Zymoseptoria tritici ST99CH_1A5]
MADRTPVSPIRPEESATTREEIDFNDNDQETGTVSPQGQETPSRPEKVSSPRPRVSFNEQTEDIPPTKPPRPVSPNLQAENTLIEAFPTIDTKVVKAVLAASGGNVEPAFNALLGMSDPDFQAEEARPPPQPPRPTQRQPVSQLEADEQYARRLAEQYNYDGQRTQNRYNQREPGRRGPNSQRHDDEEGKERSFFDDDLPEIGRNIQEGFLETQKVVNSWITNFKKKIDGDEDEDLYSGSQSGSRQNSGNWPPRQNFGSSQSEQLHGIRRSAERTRRSTETQRYDADPHELGADAFERLELRDDEAPPPQPPRTSSRKSANPDLFKPQPKPPQSGPVDEVDAADRKSTGNNASDTDKSKKWQPLTSVTPAPEDDNDPFSLGDDDEEKDKTEDLRKEDSERLKTSARNSISADTSGSAPKPLEETETSNTGRNKEAEELLTGKKS